MGTKKTDIKIQQEIRVEPKMELLYHPNLKEGSITLRFADCSAYLSHEGEKIGSIEGVVGGGLQISFEKEGVAYLLTAKEIWNATCIALGKEDHILK